ncbi:hypothetical protein [Desulfotomaculum nigrificans]|uniref:hypothetical protein n=1 Tax=Desulfotomaculum nigrificans TaxID=1565 RepID=UPI001FA7CFD1|nr:hypothetical protein [Desulfotomaculum nigrificans]
MVRFFRVSDLVSVLQQKHAEGTMTKFRKELLKAEGVYKILCNWIIPSDIG